MFDLFVSYARRDNTQGRISQLVEHVCSEYRAFTGGRELQVFFDTQEIRGMDDWQYRLERGLKSSRLLLACISPAYLASDYCASEFNVYVNHELARALSEGIAPLYFVEVPDWTRKEFGQTAAAWVQKLRERHYFDVRPWFNEGVTALKDAAVKRRMDELNQQLRDRLGQIAKAENPRGNVDRHNERFIGRSTELRRLRDLVRAGKLGMLTAVHGLGGVGKTAIATEYAYAFAHEYQGGRWQVPCEGQTDLRRVLILLAGTRDLRFDFTECEKQDLDLQFERVLYELRSRATAADPEGRVLIILDNVDQPELITPLQVSRLPRADWLHVLLTTRLGPHELVNLEAEAFVSVDQLSEDEGLELIERYQPLGKFSNEAERNAAREIVQMLESFTLAVESAAVYLGQFREVTCAGFRDRLKQEGLTGLETAGVLSTKQILHGEKSLCATLIPTIEQLGEPERLALIHAAELPADQIALPWLRALVSKEFPEFQNEPAPGYPDPWQRLLQRLVSLRLLQLTSVRNDEGQPLIARMHRIVQQVVKSQKKVFSDLVEEGHDPLDAHLERIKRVIVQILYRCKVVCDNWLDRSYRWEIEPLKAICSWHRPWIDRNWSGAEEIRVQVARVLENLARYVEAEDLLRQQLVIEERVERNDYTNSKLAMVLNRLGSLLTKVNRLDESEDCFRRALQIKEQLYGKQHTQTAIALHNLGFLLEHRKQTEKAEELYAQAIAILEKTTGATSEELGLCLMNLGRLVSRKRPQDGERMLRQALVILEQTSGPNDPSVAGCLSDLGLILKGAEGESLLRRSVSIYANAYDNHPDLATALDNLAILLATNPEKCAEAEQLSRQALGIAEKIYGTQHSRYKDYVAALNYVLHTAQQTEKEARQS